MSSVDGDHSIISRLDKNLVHKICSGQVVVTLASAVKELLENSIDAKSTKIGFPTFLVDVLIIEIRLRGHGSESIEVIDNGVGIGEEDFESLTGKYCTSKLNTFDDLSCVETYGFRGEALSSLCHLALARSQGTTVCVNQLFYDLPVRRRHLTDPNRLSKEFAKVISLLTAYCLVCVGVQISCSRVGKKGIFGYVSKPPDPSTSISSSLIDSSPSPSSTSKRRTCIGYSSSERQFIYINGRPCDLPKVTRLATDLWRRCSKEAYSSMASGISLPNRSTFNSFPVLIFIFTMPTPLTKAVLVKTLFNSNGMEINSFSQSRIDFDQSQIVSMPIHNKRQSILSDISVSPKRGHYSCDQLSSSSLEIIDLSPDASIHQQSKVEETPLEHLQSFNLKGEDHLKDYPDYENIENRLLSSDINLESIKVEFSMESLRNNWKQILQMTPSGSAEISLSNNNLHNNTHINDDNPTEGSFTFSKFKSIENQEAENELTTYFEKETFNSLQVIGQFNLGFIIARHNQDLFIVDQHASDEKYRFEQLSENYRFKSQPLVVPKKLNLTVANEQVLINNLDVFAKNGFAFRIHNDEPPGQQVFLVAAPMLENKLFSYRDIEEMLFVLSETCNKRCRPSRLRDILASRSCRSAVMVGTALDQKKMKRNCPHGRPTMRHLFHLDLVNDN
ncbi:Mismatch repair endonuclease PMS2 [Schistosoma japonicum]|nr:Mismatch repair endonuclease PMS2 [Schistosoma japonicum]